MKRSPPHSFLSLKEEKSLPVPSRFIFQIQLSVEKGLLGLCACACECQCVCFCRCVSSCPAPPESPPRILFFAGVERILKKKRMILSFPDVFCYCFPPPRTCSETSSFRRFIFEITFYCFFFYETAIWRQRSLFKYFRIFSSSQHAMPGAKMLFSFFFTKCKMGVQS